MLFGSARKTAAGTVLKRRGANDLVRAAVLRGVQPFTGGDNPKAATRALSKEIDRMAQRFAGALHRAADAAELQAMAYVVLSSYAHVAAQAGDEELAASFREAAWACRVELTPEALEELKAKL